MIKTLCVVLGVSAILAAPVAATESESKLAVITPVIADGQPRMQAAPDGRSVPVVTQLREGALYDSLQREAREGVTATMLALDESAQRAAGIAQSTASWLYLAIEDGGFPRHGFWLESDGSQRYVDQPYVDLVVDADSIAKGDFEEIFAHEMGHVFLRRLMPLPDGWSRTPHSSMAITDYPTAFDEGFATHFQGLARRLTRNSTLREQELGLASKPFLSYWLSNLDRAGRIEGVRRNSFVQARMTPPGSDGDALNRANESTAFDMARLRSGQQMLASEGVVATLFYRWLVPGPEQPAAIVARYRRLFDALRRPATEKTSADAPLFLDVVERYCVKATDDCARVRALTIDTTYGATIGTELPRQTQALAERGRVGDMQAYLAQLKQARATLARLQDEVARDPRRLHAALRADLWLLARNPNKPQAAPDDRIAVNLNTAEREALLLLPGLDTAMVDRALDSRRREGGFRDLNDFVRRSGIPADVAGRLGEAEADLRKLGPYRRQ